MAYQTLIDKDISELEIFKVITTAYIQLASIRIQKSKDTVILNRNYLRQINQIFQEVLTSYNDQAKRLGKKSSKKGELTFISHNGRDVAVLMSSNSGLYGDLIQRTFNEFLDYTRKNDVEATIIGKYGLALFEAEEPNKPF